jgi:uncharacterized repeat protein (TIGR01451 family)
VTLRWTVTSCSTAPEDVVIRLGNRTLPAFSLPAGQTRSDTIIVPMPACSQGGRVTFNGEATATGACLPAATKTASCDVECQKPRIEMTNTATPVVEAGGTVHYVLVVRNPSTTVPLENVVLTDELCSNTNNPRNFSGTCAGAGSPTVSGSRLTWPAFNLAPGAACTVEFDATLVECKSCINSATVVGSCSDDRVTAADTSLTTCPQPGRCWLTGGGQSYDSKGHLHSYGGVINPGCSPTASQGGNWNDRDHTTGAHFKGLQIEVVRCGNVPGIPPGSQSPKTPFNFIEFRGTGTITGIKNNNKKTDVSFFGYYEDRSEPGSLGQPNPVKKDRYFLRVFTNPSNPIGTTVMLVDVDGNSATQDPATIFHGNLQIHISGCDKPLAPGIYREPVDEAGVEELETMLPGEVSFGAARPNPTLSMAEIRYGLPEATEVSGKVFDVAGRMVRDLGEGPVAAGWHSITWDLRDQSGVRVGAGMYFIRVMVAGKPFMRPVTVLK